MTCPRGAAFVFLRDQNDDAHRTCRQALGHVGMEPVLVVNLALKFDSLHDWHDQSIRHHPRRKQPFSACMPPSGDGSPPPWFRIRPAERRVGQARHLVIVFTRSNAASHKNLRGWTRHSPLVTRHCPSQFALGIDRGFVIERKAHGHKRCYCACQPSSPPPRDAAAQLWYKTTKRG